MSMPVFDVVRPRTLDAALEALARYGPDAQMVAGGTDLIPSMKQGLFAPRALLDLKGIRELDFIRYHPGADLTLGALTRISTMVESPEIARFFPALHEAAKTIASPLLRNMGTLGGNLCLDTRCLYYNQSSFWRDSIGGCIKKDGIVCHVAPGGQLCWAVFSGDTAPALLALNATVQLSGPRGQRELPLAEFYVNDGIARMAKARDEIVTSIRVPASNAGWTGTYKKLRLRQSIDYPLAGVAVSMRKDSAGNCLEARVAVTAVNPAPQLVKAAELLQGKQYDAELVERVAHEAIRTGKPLRTSASTPEYRRHMIRVFVRRALCEVWTNGHAGGAANRIG
ncbi:MAG TPA: FAD binding domain-containing protein [Terriglobia bacterium]|nr:FAD binding domain-containing protein [Terriglobia bacterium]